MKNEWQERKPLEPPGSLFDVLLLDNIVVWEVGFIS